MTVGVYDGFQLLQREKKLMKGKIYIYVWVYE